MAVSAPAKHLFLYQDGTALYAVQADTKAEADALLQTEADAGNLTGLPTGFLPTAMGPMDPVGGKSYFRWIPGSPSRLNAQAAPDWADDAVTFGSSADARAGTARSGR